MWIATAATMRALDEQAVREGTSIQELMDRAGTAVYKSIRTDASIAVVCGKGNNGGDGFVVARRALEDGRNLKCIVAANASDLSPEALKAMQVFQASGGDPIFLSDSRYGQSLDDLGEFDVIVDALLGTGARGAPRGAIDDALRAINSSRSTIFSIDVPSGLECDSGEPQGNWAHATFTITLGYPKPFLYQGAYADTRGDWAEADIGLPMLESSGAYQVDHSWVRERLPCRPPSSHKGLNGHVLIVAGSYRMRGAAILSAQAALRTGASLVTVAAHPTVCDAVASLLPECLLLPMDSLDARLVLQEEDRFDAGLFGPGMGSDPQVREFLANVFSKWSRPAVVDADALNAVAGGVALPNAPCVLTPHPGEAKRLGHAGGSRFDVARELAGKLCQCVLLKGRYSIVSTPDAPLLLNATGNPGLATGGSGDTLAGIIATFLSQGLEPRDAAACGMFIHGLAADWCAEEIGSIGYTPSDVSAALPWVRDRI